MNAMIGSSLLLADEGYQISRSVRLRSSANAYLQRTNATTGTDPLKFTVSGWMKRGASTTYFPLLGSATGSAAFDFIGFSADNFAFRIRNSSSVDVVQLISTAVFRDFSAWYHFVAVYDSANATSTERVKLYVNGVQITSFSTATYPSLNQGFTGDFLTDMQIGRTNTNSTNQNYGDGYITEVNFIDGQALTPSSFGETNTVTGVWQPKKYAGTYGTNGFYLNFSDNSAATAAAIGKDYSGNGNDWTPNNISVTAGATYDSMLDVPTQWADGDNGRGNYAVMSPLDGVLPTLTNGNLQVSIGAGTSSIDCGTMAVTSGKWYWEVSPSTISNNAMRIGVSDFDLSLANRLPSAAGGWSYNSNGNKVNNGTSVAYGSAYTTSNIIGVALDMDTGTLEFFEDGVSQGTAYSTGLAGKLIGPAITNGTGTGAQAAAFNFGQRPFAYTPPSGFKALNTLNLPTPTILKGNQYFDAVAYAGSASQQTITTSLTGLDFAWIKNRSAARSHVLVDRVRGGSPLLTLYSELTAAEDNTSPNYNPTSFTASGIVLGGAKLGINNAGENFVLWGWEEGATQGFDIVTYTGNATTNRTVAHALGVQPSMFIIKARSTGTTSWIVHHKNLGNNGGSPAYLQYLFLESTAAKAASTSLLPVAGLSSTTFPTSGATNNTNVNGNGTTYVAYLFAEVAGFSKFGSYTGNGSADGPFVFCGFRPRFIMFKRTDAISNWVIVDTARSTYNETTVGIVPNSSSAETTGVGNYDILANGFKCRNVIANEANVSGGTYIFAAFAEHPFKNALAR